MKKILASFGSDNYSGVSSEVMQALQEANQGHVPSYGKDPYTAEAIKLFREEFGEETQVFFTFTATGANVASLASLTRPYNSIIMASSSHVHTLEVGAVYAHTGCKSLIIPSQDGKIYPEQIAEKVKEETHFGPHATIPKVVSLSQSTEVGTVYTLREIQLIAETCRRHHLYLHVDGCRLFNAAVALDIPLRSFGKEAGIDVLVFGGTKNGLMSAESVLFFKPELAEHFAYIQKQRLQLTSKMRFLSAQYIPFLKDELWKKNAVNANEMAKLLADGLKQFPFVEFTQKVESNQLFLKIPMPLIKKLQEEFLFLVYDDKKPVIRMITSFDTTQEEVDLFIEKVKKYRD